MIFLAVSEVISARRRAGWQESAVITDSSSGCGHRLLSGPEVSNLSRPERQSSRPCAFLGSGVRDGFQP